MLAFAVAALAAAALAMIEPEPRGNAEIAGWPFGPGARRRLVTLLLACLCAAVLDARVYTTFERLRFIVVREELRACSFDRGFHSRDNRVRLDALLDVNALPGRGYLSRADREREEEESFVAGRRAHPAIESAINGLEHRGLDRVRSHGADGFARTVALSVLAANLRRIELILHEAGTQTTTTRRLTNRP